jgi:hypothetical protein
MSHKKKMFCHFVFCSSDCHGLKTKDGWHQKRVKNRMKAKPQKVQKIFFGDTTKSKSKSHFQSSQHEVN